MNRAETTTTLRAIAEFLSTYPSTGPARAEAAGAQIQARSSGGGPAIAAGTAINLGSVSSLNRIDPSQFAAMSDLVQQLAALLEAGASPDESRGVLEKLSKLPFPLLTGLVSFLFTTCECAA